MTANPPITSLSNVSQLSDTPEVEFAFGSDTGLTREHNLDQVMCRDNLCLVADGLGQQNHNKQAASMVINSVLGSVGAGKELSLAIKTAHEALMQANFAGATESGKELGSTIVACELWKNSYKVAWVGDSRAYLWTPNDNSLQQITEDHSLVNHMVKEGQLTPKMARQHPRRHVMTQCLGLSPPSRLRIDARTGYLLPSQIIMLCSDGLSDSVSKPILRSILQQAHDRREPLQTTVQTLIQQANQQGGNDNISVTLARLMYTRKM